MAREAVLHVHPRREDLLFRAAGAEQRINDLMRLPNDCSDEYGRAGTQDGRESETIFAFGAPGEPVRQFLRFVGLIHPVFNGRNGIWCIAEIKYLAKAQKSRLQRRSNVSMMHHWRA